MKKNWSRIWPPGVRLQLTLWYTAIFAVLILGSGILVYNYLEYSLGASIDADLLQRAKQFASEISYDNGNVTIHDTTGSLPDSNMTQMDQHDKPPSVDVSSLVRILDAQGFVVAETLAFQQLQLPDACTTRPLQGQTWQGTVSVYNNPDVRLYSMAVMQNGMPIAVVQVGESLSQIHTVLYDLALVLFLLIPVMLLLSAFVSYWLAGRAFAPIQRLTSTARQIKAGNLHQRVPVPVAQDEVHFLALTLNEMIERLEEAFERQRRFVADASHELRTPVAAIRSKTDLALLRDLTPQEHIAVLQNINAESERLGRLVSDLLALARVDEGRSTLEAEPVQLDVLVSAVVANAEVLAQERGIHLRVEASEPLTVMGDEARLIQAVMNLVDNALTYTQTGGRVTVKIGHDRTAAYIIVSDTGEGIAPEHLPHIFERFYRADPARTRREGGSSGLGLAIVDWVVHAHGGAINVESQPGKGSTFTISLPLSVTKSASRALLAR